VESSDRRGYIGQTFHSRRNASTAYNFSRNVLLYSTVQHRERGGGEGGNRPKVLIFINMVDSRML
jgi:hypothetical protein